VGRVDFTEKVFLEPKKKKKKSLACPLSQFSTVDIRKILVLRGIYS
jgi:hypothetical protein